MTLSTIYLVSGANRGIGLALVTHILANIPDAVVYAGCRDPENAGSLKSLQETYTERLTVLKLVSADVAGNVAAAKQIEEKHGRVDTVIANAGISNKITTVAEVPPAALDEHFHINVTGTIVLFQAVYALLKKSAQPRFVPISSSVGRLGGPMVEVPFGNVAYGASKAALNWATRKIHFENDWLVAFPMCPGPVDTDLLRHDKANDVNGAFDGYGNFVIPTPESAAAALLSIISGSTREKEGGEFVLVSGEHLGW